MWILFIIWRIFYIILKLIGFKGLSDDGDTRWNKYNPIAWVLVTTGTFLLMCLGKNPFKTFSNAFRNDDIWNGI